METKRDRAAPVSDAEKLTVVAARHPGFVVRSEWVAIPPRLPELAIVAERGGMRYEYRTGSYEHVQA